MKNPSLIPKVFKIAFIFLMVCFLWLAVPATADAVTNPIAYTITVSATLGEPKLTIFGYTSPFARVQLQGQRVWEETTANNQGYFLFDRVFLPRANPDYPEVCLTPIDSQKLTSFPVCLPRLPVGPFDISIGPVLLAPSLSLQKGSFLGGQQVQAQGMTIPETEVTIFFAQAFSLPHYQIKANQDGYFEFNLPKTFQPNQWRVFAGTNFLGAASPKSNTLTFRILKPWEWGWQQLQAGLKRSFSFLGPYWWVLVVLIEVCLIVLLLHLKLTRTLWGKFRLPTRASIK